MLAWLESLPLSKLPYVEMGFDALEIDLVQKLEQHNLHVKTCYAPIELKVQPMEHIKIVNVY